MGRRLLLGLLVLGALLFAAAGLLWMHLRPPLLAVPPAGELAIADVTVVQPGAGREPHRTIRIANGRILAVEPTGDSAAGAGKVDRAYAGDFALPGLIDMHVHHPPATPFGDIELFELLFLSHGVTTVRDAGSFDGSIFDTRRRIRSGQIAGPRIFACGPIIDGDPPFWPGSRVVRGDADARQAVHEVAALGADCVKVYEHLTPESLAAIEDEAATVGLPVIGHVPDQVEFAEAKLADVQHLTGVFQKGVLLKPSRIRAVITTSAALHIAHTPTLVVYDHLGRLSDYERERAAPASRLLPRYYRDVLWNPKNDRRFAASDAKRWHDLQEALAPASDLVRHLHEAGVEIHAGTDTMNPFVIPGVSMHEELRLLVGAGFTPEQAWQAATRQSGEFLREPGLGTIAAGAPADVVLFREDPTRDLAALDSIDAVIAGGRLYSRAALDETLARWREHFADPVYDQLTMAMSEWLARGRTQ